MGFNENLLKKHILVLVIQTCNNLIPLTCQYYMITEETIGRTKNPGDINRQNYTGCVLSALWNRQFIVFEQILSIIVTFVV